MASLLGLREGMKVLEIGTGCGYSAAVASYLIGPSGKLTTIERDENLARLGRKNIDDFLRKGNLTRAVEVVHADGSGGYSASMPFDRIYFTAGSTGDMPLEPLVRQLNECGKLLVPHQRGPLNVFNKGSPDPAQYGNYSFVPIRPGIEPVC